MIIKSKNFVLKLEEILKDELPTERYNEYENFVLKIIRSWYSEAQYFHHQTSGSTGRPAKIKISREKIKISTVATMNAIDPHKSMKTSLLCLDPTHIGGAMVVYRSLISGFDLTIREPTSESILNDNHEYFDLVSMVPLQFKKLSTKQMNQFGTILIGGAPLAIEKVDSKANIYATFGMTETVSHIALRKIDEPLFRTTGDNEISVDENQILKIKGSVTDYKWLITNDIVKMNSGSSFEWIGRKDFIINSGGIKVNPEELERLLEKVIDDEFIISSLPDEKLNEKVILISGGPEREIDFSLLEKYHRPKACFFNQTIVKTASGKTDRLKTRKKLEETL